MTKTNTAPTGRRHLRTITIGELRVDIRAQRTFRQYWADHLLANFDPELFEPPHVCQRNDHYYIIDGQHRVAAIKTWLGAGWEDQQIQAWDYGKLSEDEQARLFLYLNRGRKAVRSADDFRVALTAKEPVETDVERIVTANGQVIAQDGGEGITCHGTLKNTYLREGPNPFGAMVRTNNGAFGDSGFEAKLVEGVAAFYGRYNGGVEEARAIARLTNVRGGAKGLLGKAYIIRDKTRKPLRDCVAAAVVDTYNGGAGSKIPAWFA